MGNVIPFRRPPHVEVQCGREHSGRKIWIIDLVDWDEDGIGYYGLSVHFIESEAIAAANDLHDQGYRVVWGGMR